MLMRCTGTNSVCSKLAKLAKLAHWQNVHQERLVSKWQVEGLVTCDNARSAVLSWPGAVPDDLIGERILQVEPAASDKPFSGAPQNLSLFAFCRCR